LSFKRRVLRDPPIARALVLLCLGLEKPVSSPRQSLSYDTRFPEFAGFRGMARLLKLQQYVLFADGHVPDAIASSRMELQLGKVIQTDTLISGLVGVAITAITARSIGEHLDQLSARDCDALFRIAREWLQQPNNA